jgi:hypothetical protein
MNEDRAPQTNSAQAKVRPLEGKLPNCASCKNILDDNGARRLCAGFAR